MEVGVVLNSWIVQFKLLKLLLQKSLAGRLQQFCHMTLELDKPFQFFLKNLVLTDLKGFD